MKKITAALAALAVFSSTAALADTPAVREMNNFDSIMKKVGITSAPKNSEFVIYHQDAHKPLPPKAAKKDKKHGKKGEHHKGEHHKGEHKGEHKKHGKKADKPVAKMKSDAAPKTDSSAETK